jgi:glycogen synthase
VSGRLSVLMTVDTVGGVWSYALGLCASLPQLRFVLASLGPPPRQAQRDALAGLGNVTLAESDFRLEWMVGGQADIAASRRWLDVLADRHAVDLVHVNGYAPAKLDGERPVVAVAHSDVLSWWFAVHGVVAPVEWIEYRRQVVCGLALAAQIVVPTKAVWEDLRRQYGLSPRKTTVIPNGLDIRTFSPQPKRPVIMAAGRIWDAAKNLRLLDDIAPRLAWPIEIAGEVAHPEHGVARLVHAWPLGVLAPTELRNRLEQAAIFAAPALYEPFGLGILEAAAAGCALVLGDISSLRENWDDAAIFLPPADRDSWRAALGRLIGDRRERKRLAAAARARSERFALTSTARRYLTLYRELIGASVERRVA